MRAPPLSNLQPRPPDPGPSYRASSLRTSSKSRTSGTASRCGGTAAAGCLGTPPSGTARVNPPLTCLWMSWRRCCSPGSSLQGLPGLSHRTSMRSSTKGTPRGGAPPPGRRWPCTWLRCWSPDTTDQKNLLKLIWH